MSDIKKSSGEQAYDVLLGEIRMGTYTPGDRLREEDVASRLRLSRTPIREALRRLESDGIVEHRPRVGAVIRTLAHTEVVELYEMRMVLERTAAEMAAKHGASAEFDALEVMNDRIAAERDNPALGAAINQDFHRGLYLAGRNRFLLEASRALNNALLLLGPTTYTDPERIDVVVRQHSAIITALREGDAEAAGAAAEGHLQTSLLHRLRSKGN
ncbi:GntR family transcriptional regulator [Thalassococcus lentus]|uniref:GntR family transcriptional regulator n=1 Tax=Thalassococcus lentus TaxID=1210524 RepID=A0ABT4XNW9_9RHOB|nr:GntR family transcriptional regulator [Thalassococcus lentus]MDA7423630.1 GntR family transcriptional regulator [Thalassococcus lentus]